MSFVCLGPNSTVILSSSRANKSIIAELKMFASFLDSNTFDLQLAQLVFQQLQHVIFGVC